MNINRDNYEEYILLYADNELTDSEKAEVLMFIKDNKDLEDEFRMIHYTISKPDNNVELADKSFLLKNDSAAFINERNYEEIFVLFHDNELTTEQRLETEQFLSRHPRLKDEFELIGLARFTSANEVVFPNKKLLYKKEKVGKLVPIVFWRVLAAAIFLGLGLWATYSYFNKPQKIVAVNNQQENRKPLPASVAQKPTTKQYSDTTSSSSIATNEYKVTKPDAVAKATHNAGTSIGKNKDKSDQDIDRNDLKPVPASIDNSIVVDDQKIKNLSRKEVTAINVIQPSTELTATATLNNKAQEPVAYTVPASFVQDAENKTDNYVFYDVSTDEFKKTKMGGFLKKVKRVIERNNPIGRLISGDDRQVASN